VSGDLKEVKQNLLRPLQRIPDEREVGKLLVQPGPQPADIFEGKVIVTCCT